MAWFSKKTVVRDNAIYVQPAVSPMEHALGTITRANALYSDALGINTEGGDPTKSIDVVESTIFGPEARIKYRSLDVVQRIIDAPAHDALRQGFTIKTNYDEYKIGNLLMERLESLDYKRVLLKWLIYSRLFSRGALMVPVVQETNMLPGRHHLKAPLKFANLEKVEKLNVVREELFSYRVQSYDPLASNFEDFEYVNVFGINLDPSRYYLLVQSLDPVRQRGISTLEKINTACMGLNIAEWTIVQLLLRYRSLIVKYNSEELTRILASGKNDSAGVKAKMAELLNTIKMQFTSKSVAAMPSTYDAQYITTSFDGLKDATDFLYAFLSTTSRVPQNIIRGSAQGELASSMKDQRDYYELVKSEEQNIKLDGILQFIFPYLIHEKDGKIYDLCMRKGISLNDINPKVAFNPLQSVDPMQDAQIRFTEAQTFSLLQQGGLVDSEVIKADVYSKLFPHAEIPDFPDMASELVNAPADPWGLFEKTKVNFPNVWETIRKAAEKKAA